MAALWCYRRARSTFSTYHFDTSKCQDTGNYIFLYIFLGVKTKDY